MMAMKSGDIAEELLVTLSKGVIVAGVQSIR